jgi:hypothetical protein
MIYWTSLSSCLFLSGVLAACCHGTCVADDGVPVSKQGTIARTVAVFTPNDFEGTDAERINRAVEVASAKGGRVLVPRWNLRGNQRRDVWLLDEAILLRNDTTLELDSCRIKLSDRCRDNFFRSANCGLGISNVQSLQNIHIRGVGGAVLEGADHPRATGDSGKKLGARTYGTDAQVVAESQAGDWRNIGILLAFVEDFSIENLTIKDSHCWAISLERCAHGRLRDIDFASSGFRMIDTVRQPVLNQDGIDLRLGCHDILIENITGYTGDDLIALTAIAREDSISGRTASTMVSGARDRGDGQDNIRHIILRNIKGYCRGGHHIVRLLNTSGVRMYNVLLDGLIDTSPAKMRCKAAVKIGDRGYGTGVAPLGDTSRMIVNNVISRATHTILIGGTLADSIITNVVRYDADGEAVTVEQGPQAVRNVSISNVQIVGH